MLIVSEVSEAMEADRKGRFLGDGPRMHEREFETPDQFIEWFKANVKDTFEDELADAAIRIFDLAFQMKIDLDYHIRAKMKYNKNREFMHGGKKY
jgi:NTP pyrophosphatase (non-canonical NTP hydrolase)